MGAGRDLRAVEHLRRGAVLSPVPFAFLFLRVSRHAVGYLVGFGMACLLLRIGLVHAPVNYVEPEKIGASSGLYYFTFSYVPMFVWGSVAAWLYLNPDRAVPAVRVLAFPPMLLLPLRRRPRRCRLRLDVCALDPVPLV